MKAWCERYRPLVVNDCILPNRIKAPFSDFVERKQFPNLLLSGSPGTGKTSTARALCSQLDLDVRHINGSDNGAFDVIETEIRPFCRNMSPGGKYPKVVLIDEADGVDRSSVQSALRGVIEEYSATSRFIFTANHKERLHPALHSRCAVIDFDVLEEERPHLIEAFLARARWILDNEQVVHNWADVTRVIEQNFPDFRRALNDLERYVRSGQLVLPQDYVGLREIHKSSAAKEKDRMTDLVEQLRDQSFDRVRVWVARNASIDHQRLFRMLYDYLPHEVEAVDRGLLVMTIADYQFKATNLVDHEINTVACLSEIMNAVTFKSRVSKAA